jgi:hypothetical protein
MNKHERLKTQANDAVQALFDDTSVSKEQTKEDLEEIVDEIGFKIKSLGE